MLRRPFGETLEGLAVEGRPIKAGVFDAQNLVTVPHATLVRKLGSLPTDQLAEVEAAVRRWLGL